MVKPDTAEKLEILIVDDRPENLLTLEAVLESPDYRLIRASSGDEALKYLLDNEPALILMDVQMPDLNGFETASIIKKSERLREIPIIFITAINKDERYAHEGYAHGAVDYIFKPYDAAVLRSKVSVFADLSKKTRRLLRVEKQLRETERRDRERQIAQLEIRNLKREQAEQKRYRELVDGIEHGIVWSADAYSLKVSFASPSATRILGFPPEKWTAEDDFLIRQVHPDDSRRFFEAVRKVHDTKQPERFEHRFLDSQGRSIWVHTGLRIARNHDDSGYEIRGLSTDVTKIKEAEEILQKNKTRSDVLAEASLVLTESLDAEKTLPRLGEFLIPRIADGYAIEVPNEDGSTRTIAVTRGKTASARLAQKIADKRGLDPYSAISAPEAFRTTRPVLYPEVTEKHLRRMAQDDTHFSVLKDLGMISAISVPLRTRERIFGVMTLITSDSGRRYDETDLALAEDLGYRIGTALDNADLYRQAREAIHARDEFLSVASHELKTPLTPLKLHTQSLMRSMKQGGEVKKEKVMRMLETSDRQITRLSRLVDDLLDVSRITVGKMNLTLEEFDLVDLVRDILDRFADQCAAAKCDVSLHAPSSIRVNWDRFRTEQVVINLLTNAIKYGAGKPVEIHLDTVDGKARISVRDRGIGIAKENQPKIFERFERAVPGTHYAGLGLGLYIVSQILRAHGGKIDVESDLGKGSRFTVDIPIRAEGSATEHSPSAAIESPLVTASARAGLSVVAANPASAH
jgi:PAS domain S-box-containing protein